MLSAPIPRERFEAIRRRRAQVAKITRLMQHVELAKRLLFDAAEALYALPHPQAFGGAVTERPDHVASSIAPLVIRQAYNV